MMWIISLVCAILIFVLVFFIRPLNQASPQPIKIAPSPSAVSSTSPAPLKILGQKTIPQKLHVFQTFNNCGPAALSMALSYFDINVSQQELGKNLRPFQNPQGDNDDKSVTLAELAKKAREYNFLTYHRPAGDINTIKLFISYDMPVIVRTWLKENDDIGHYRLIRGFDDTLGQFIQDDSLQGADLKYSYGEFLNLWQGFNYEYLVLVPKEKQALAESILRESNDEKKAWEKALELAQKELQENPDDIFTKFNISVGYYYLGDYQKAVEIFELIEDKLPFRMLWYQIEPILAYQKLKKYDKVFTLTDKILGNHNRAFSELYQIRGEIYLEQGKPDLAKAEFEKARLYNETNFPI